MLLDSFISKPEDFPHIISAIQHSHEVLINRENELLIFCPIPNMYIAEYSGKDVSGFANEIKKNKIVRLQTTNENLFSLLKNDFAEKYKCVQAVFPEGDFVNNSLKPIDKKDLPYISETYGLQKYINQLFEKNRLFGLYENSNLLGYVAFHIDESIGALYVDPAYRNKGLGAEIMKDAFKIYKDGIRYSQIIYDNISSIKLHEKIGCKISKMPLYWVYDEDFIYSEK